MNEIEFRENLEKYRNNPKISGLVDTMNAIAHKSVFEPEFRESWIKASIWRDGNIVEIRWETTRHNEPDYNVAISMDEIAFSSADGIGGKIMFPMKRGNGKLFLQLDEGSSHYFRMCFTEDEDIEGLVLISFQLHIPLSPESRRLFTQAKHLEDHPEDEITKRVESYMRKQDNINSAFEAGVEHIKNKGLSPEEEAQRIEDFREELKWMSEGFHR